MALLKFPSLERSFEAIVNLMKGSNHSTPKGKEKEENDFEELFKNVDWYFIRNVESEEHKKLKMHFDIKNVRKNLQ